MLQVAHCKKHMAYKCFRNLFYSYSHPRLILLYVWYKAFLEEPIIIQLVLHHSSKISSNSYNQTWDYLKLYLYANY
jgi:hypothetical protein